MPWQSLLTLACALARNRAGTLHPPSYRGLRLLEQDDVCAILPYDYKKGGLKETTI